jgi:hypothetical protein
MKNQYYTWRKNKPNYVKSDGKHKVGDVIGYSPVGFSFHYDTFFVDNKIFKATIVDIQLLQDNTHEYKIRLNISGQDGQSFWVKKNNIKKIKKDDWLKLENPKFKVGQIVYILNWRMMHEQAMIMGASLSLYDTIEYHVYNKDKELDEKIIIRERELRGSKNNIEESSKFKIGDNVSVRNYWLEPHVKSERYGEIVEMFTYDDDPAIFCRLKGYYDMIIDEFDLVKFRHPVVIFSDMDPYGEEDWGE